MTKNKQYVSNCPPSVKKLFAIANSIPKNGESLLIMAEIYEAQLEEVETQKRRFYEIIKKVSEEFLYSDERMQAFLEGKAFKSPHSSKPGWQPISEWEEKWLMHWKNSHFSPLGLLFLMLDNALNICRSLAKARGFAYDPDEIFHPISNVTSEPRPRFISKAELSSQGFFVKNGIIEVRLNPTFSVLVNEKIDIRRIGFCFNCDNYFWVKRLNKNAKNETCENCSDKIRQQRFQTNNRNELNEKRRRNYYKDNKIPFCEECVRPNKKCNCKEKKINGTL